MTSLDEGFAALWSSLLPIGLCAETGGYRRFAWTDTDARLRAWFVEQAEARGMRHEVDRNGNQWAWWGEDISGANATGAKVTGAIVTGSHLDSVPDGGPYDGPLGIVSAYLAVDDLRARGAVPTRPIAVVNFAEEEGARFGVACLGSRLLTGVVSPREALALTDAAGVTLHDALASAGVDVAALGRDDERLAAIGAFVELHIEQGRALVEHDAVVGVATGIWPHERWRFTFAGEANHAGTTPLADRRDPMLPFALTVLSARACAAIGNGLATFGRAHVVPNATNAIAASLQGWLDVRAPDDDALEALVAAIDADARSAATAYSCTVDVERESTSPGVTFDESLRDRVAAALGQPPTLATGAGHDAGILAAFVPTAMLFVRNLTGASHSPAEHADVADCLAGVRALAAVLKELACR